LAADPPSYSKAGNFEVPVFDYLPFSSDYFDVLNGECLQCGARHFDLYLLVTGMVRLLI